MNVTLPKILGVVTILIVLGVLLTIVVKNDGTSKPTSDDGASTTSSSASSTDDTNPDDQRAFAMLPPSKQMLAPDFTLQTSSGGSITLSAAVKKGPVLIDFWASYCGPCRMELPVYESLYKKYKAKGIQFYTINSSDQMSDIRTIAKATGLTMPMLTDPTGEVSSKYGVDAIPVTLVINKDQKCVAGSMGYDPAMDQDLPITLDKLVAQVD